MYSVTKANRFQLGVISYFIFGNLLFSLILGLLGINPGIVTSILVSQVLMVGLTVVVYKFYTASSWSRDFFIKPLAFTDILICVGIAWTIMPLLSFINVVSQFVVENQIQDALADMLSLPLLVTLFLTGILPATLEELLSRSIILRNYQKKTVMVTCLVSGMFFGFIHLNINQFLYAFVMGAIMSYVVMVTGSILSSMTIHFIINATGTTTLYAVNGFLRLFENNEALLEDIMSTSQPTTMELFISATMMFFMALFFTPVAGILINLLLKRHNKSFKGSLKMYTEDFMIVGSGRDLKADFTSDMKEAEEVNDYDPPQPEEKLWTLPLILSAGLFLAFSIIIEVSLRMAA